MSRECRQARIGLAFAFLCVFSAACRNSKTAASSTSSADGTGSATATSTPRSTTKGITSTGSGLTLDRLSSLTNYTYTTVSGNGGYTFTVTGQVHSPTNWQATSSAPRVTTYDVGGRGYAVALGQVSPVTFRSPQGFSHLAGEYSAAESLVGYTHVAGISITTGGACSAAGASGTTYHVKSPSADASILVETATACVANSTGALLSYTSGVPGGSGAAAIHLAGANITFTVEAIGGVSPISAPSPSNATTLPTLPSSFGATPGLPSGFPAAVAAPPGRIVSSVTLNPSKWYLQLVESGTGALASYASILESKGFGVVSSTITSAIDLEVLKDGAYQVQIEQLPSSGSGTFMAVTVEAAQQSS